MPPTVRAQIKPNTVLRVGRTRGSSTVLLALDAFCVLLAAAVVDAHWWTSSAGGQVGSTLLGPNRTAGMRTDFVLAEALCCSATRSSATRRSEYSSTGAAWFHRSAGDLLHHHVSSSTVEQHRLGCPGRVFCRGCVARWGSSIDEYRSTSLALLGYWS